MRYLLTIIFLVLMTTLKGQPLRDINFNYLYSPGGSFGFDLKTARQPEGWILLYSVQIRDTAFRADDFTIQWESREAINDKEGTPLSAAFEVSENARSNRGYNGTIRFPHNAAPKIIVAKVIHTSLKRAWIFYTTIEPNYPVDTYVTVNNKVLKDRFVNISDSVKINGSGQRIISYYNDEFPAALPPFAEALGRVSQAIRPDSTIFLSDAQKIVPRLTGLYLVQKDTNTTEGITFRAQDDYPRLGKIPSLAGPLVYICTRDEINKLALAKNDKKAFDGVILRITNDTDRARKLMRNYFRRVELSNQYFTSFKEGWKTDRGMIFIIFGQPDEVFKFNDREVWGYNNDLYKATFDFAKSSSIFDPDNYVLIREKKFRETWLETVDLWRGARF